jgi:hypothetical protein
MGQFGNKVTNIKVEHHFLQLQGKTMESKSLAPTLIFEKHSLGRKSRWNHFIFSGKMPQKMVHFGV